MNSNSNRQAIIPHSASDAKPIILEVVTELDARGDLTGALDLRAALRSTCEMRLLRLGDLDLGTPVNGDAHFPRLDGPGRRADLTAVLEEIRPDVVHTHRTSDLARMGSAASAAGVPRLVHTICSQFATASEQKLAEFRSLVDSLRPVVVAPSAQIARRLDLDTQVAVIPRGVDLSRNAPGEPEPARRRIGLPAGPSIVGCASPAANLDILFQALFRLGDNVHLALFGPAAPGAVERAAIRRLGLEERVHVLGAWARPELIHQAIDAYFHGPSPDSWPRPVLASQAAAKPAVAIFPASPDSLCPKTGQLLPAHFQPAILGALKRALSNTPAPRARQFVARNWNSAPAVAAYDALFHSTFAGTTAR